MFLILFTLIVIFLLDSTLGKAFDSQCTTRKTFSKKTHEECNVQRKCYGVSKLTFPQILWNQKQKTVSLSSIALSQSQMTILLLFWAAFCPNWQITIHCFFFSSFLSRLTIVPTSSFSHFHVPSNATSTATGLRIHNDLLQTSLNNVTTANVSTTTAITTVTMT